MSPHKKPLTPDSILAAAREVGASLSSIARAHGCSRQAVHKYLKARPELRRAVDGLTAAPLEINQRKSKFDALPGPQDAPYVLKNLEKQSNAAPGLRGEFAETSEQENDPGLTGDLAQVSGQNNAPKPTPLPTTAAHAHARTLPPAPARPPVSGGAPLPRRAADTFFDRVDRLWGRPGAWWTLCRLRF
jgi:hypothetical protein